MMVGSGRRVCGGIAIQAKLAGGVVSVALVLAWYSLNVAGYAWYRSTCIQWGGFLAVSTSQHEERCDIAVHARLPSLIFPWTWAIHNFPS